jgi:hypothetical protein
MRQMTTYQTGTPIVFEDEFGNVRDGSIGCADLYGNQGQYGITAEGARGLYSRRADLISPANGEEQFAIPTREDEETACAIVPLEVGLAILAAS